MGSLGVLSLSLSLLMCLISSSHGYTFYVGSKDGWVVKPQEDYSVWSGRNRFLVGDTLVFKYEKGQDSVLMVTQHDYNNCNTSKPIKSMDDGASVVTLDRPGPFYFISGKQGSCNMGQKVKITVLSPRRKIPSPPAPIISPMAQPPASAPPTALGLISPVSPPAMAIGTGPPAMAMPPTPMKGTGPTPMAMPTMPPTPMKGTGPTPMAMPTMPPTPSSVSPTSEPPMLSPYASPPSPTMPSLTPSSAPSPLALGPDNTNAPSPAPTAGGPTSDSSLKSVSAFVVLASGFAVFVCVIVGSF